LSFWQCAAKDQQTISETALAVIAGRKKAEKIEIICLERKTLEDVGIKFRATKGKTTVQHLIDSHFDAIDLDMNLLVDLAKLVARAVREKNVYHRITRKQVIELVCEAVRKEQLSIENLEDEMKRKVTQALPNHPLVEGPS
jgi:hypothetical protein